MKLRTAFRRSLIIIGSLAACTLRADLKWSVTEISLRADATKESALASFRFANDGTAPVTITEMVSSCQCTVPKLERMTYAPGEAGKLDVVVRYGRQATSSEQYIVVTTQPAAAIPVMLKVRVSAAGEGPPFERIEVLPKTVTWKLGSSPGDQIVALQIRPNDAIRPVSVTCDSPGFVAQLLDADPGSPNTFRLKITPRSTTTAARGVVSITTNSDTFNPEWRKMPPLVYQVVAAVN